VAGLLTAPHSPIVGLQPVFAAALSTIQRLVARCCISSGTKTPLDKNLQIVYICTYTPKLHEDRIMYVSTAAPAQNGHAPTHTTNRLRAQTQDRINDDALTFFERLDRLLDEKPSTANPNEHQAQTKAPSQQPIADSRQPNAPRRGRPLIFNDLRRHTFLHLVSLGFSTSQAAKNVGVSPSTVRETARLDHAFAAQYEQAKAEAMPALVENIHLAGKRSWRASAWLLERLRPGQFGRRVALGRDRWQKDTRKLDEKTIVDLIDRRLAARDAQAVIQARIAEIEEELALPRRPNAAAATRTATLGSVPDSPAPDEPPALANIFYCLPGLRGRKDYVADASPPEDMASHTVTSDACGYGEENAATLAAIVSPGCTPDASPSRGATSADDLSVKFIDVAWFAWTESLKLTRDLAALHAAAPIGCRARSPVTSVDPVDDRNDALPLPQVIPTELKVNFCAAEHDTFCADVPSARKSDHTDDESIAEPQSHQQQAPIDTAADPPNFCAFTPTHRCAENPNADPHPAIMRASDQPTLVVPDS